MKSFSKKNTPIKSTDDIKNIVKKFTLTVRNFKNGSAIRIVNVKINSVVAKYKPFSGKTIPFSKKFIAKNTSAKYAIRDFKKFLIFRQSHVITPIIYHTKIDMNRDIQYTEISNCPNEKRIKNKNHNHNWPSVLG